MTPAPTVEDLAAALEVARAEESPEFRAARYERLLRAIAACPLNGADFGDWVQSAVVDSLAGLEAECWECGTHVHDGPCVGDGDE